MTNITNNNKSLDYSQLPSNHLCYLGKVYFIQSIGLRCFPSISQPFPSLLLLGALAQTSSDEVVG